MRKPNAIYIFVVFLLTFVSSSFTFAILPEIFVNISDGDLSKASVFSGVNTGITSFAAFISSPAIGSLSDKYGRKPLLIASVIGASISLASMLAAEITRIVYILWIFSFISGLISGLLPISFAYIVDVSEIDKRSANFGLLGAAIGLGLIVGPSTSGVVAMKFGIPIALLCALSISFVALLFTIFVLPESKQERNYDPIDIKKLNPFRSFAMLLDRRLALLLSAVLILNTLGIDGIADVYILYFKYMYQLDITKIGFLLSISGVLMAATQGLGIRFMVAKFRERRAAIICQVIAMVFTFPLGFRLDLKFLMILGVFGMPGYCLTPILQSLITKEYDEKSQGELLGVLSGLKTLSAFVGPFIANNLFAFFISDKTEIKIPGITMFVASGFYVIALGIMLRAFQSHPEKKESVNKEEELESLVGEEPREDM